MDNIKLVIAENIAKLRKLENITQAELAQKLNYSDKAVSKWERGESLPDVIVLKEIAELFGVTVDYLLCEHKEDKMARDKHRKKNINKLIITLLACSLVWFLATATFVGGGITMGVSKIWIVFIYAIPITCVLLLIFNSIWGRKLWEFFILTVFVWSILTALYLTWLSKNIWLIFILGIPAQIIVALWTGLKIRIRRK